MALIVRITAVLIALTCALPFQSPRRMTIASGKRANELKFVQDAESPVVSESLKEGRSHHGASGPADTVKSAAAPRPEIVAYTSYSYVSDVICTRIFSAHAQYPIPPPV